MSNQLKTVSMSSENKIIIVDPSPILLRGLTSFIEEYSQLSVVSQLDNADRLEEKIIRDYRLIFSY